MILLLAVVFSIAVALLRGGRFSRVAAYPFRSGWLALLAFALQIAVIYYPERRAGGIESVHTLLLAGSYTLLILTALLNRKLPGVWLIGLGLALNLLVMLANGGYMPVTLESLRLARLDSLILGAEPGSRIMATKNVLLPAANTHLWVLSDIFVLPPPLPFRTVFSPGDVLLAIGAFMLFQRSMLAPVPQTDVVGPL